MLCGDLNGKEIQNKKSKKEIHMDMNLSKVLEILKEEEPNML